MPYEWLWCIDLNLDSAYELVNQSIPVNGIHPFASLRAYQILF